MSVKYESYGHSLVPKRGVQVQKMANIGFFLPNHTIRALTGTFYLIGSLVYLRYGNVENDFAFRET